VIYISSMPKNDGFQYDIFAAACPSRSLFSAVFSRWGMLVLARMHGHTLRFKELYRSVEGISEKMLAQTLKTLVVEGLMEKIDHATSPPKTEYRLTPQGEKLAQSLITVIHTLYKVLDQKS
jgi:DNA-binding HxlR family transcriptional regulator